MANKVTIVGFRGAIAPPWIHPCPEVGKIYQTYIKIM